MNDRSREELTRQAEAIEAHVWEDILRAAPAEQALALGLGVERIDDTVVGTAAALDVLMYNRAVGLGTETEATEQRIDRVLARFAAAGVPRYFVQIAPAARPEGIARWLETRGLAPYNRWAKLYRAPTFVPEPPAPRVEPIGAERAELFAAIVAEGFGLPEPLRRWMGSLVGRDGWRYYLAYEDAEAIAAAALFVRGELASFGSAATRPDRRGRGAQQALIARRIRDAGELGCRGLFVETAEDKPEKPAPSFRNLRRLGFELLYLRPNWIGLRSAAPA